MQCELGLGITVIGERGLPPFSPSFKATLLPGPEPSIAPPSTRIPSDAPRRLRWWEPILQRDDQCIAYKARNQALPERQGSQMQATVLGVQSASAAERGHRYGSKQRDWWIAEKPSSFDSTKNMSAFPERLSAAFLAIPQGVPLLSVRAPKTSGKAIWLQQLS